MITGREAKRGEVDRRGVPLIDATLDQCRFIVSDGVAPAICCGAPTIGGGSWCPMHRSVVFTPAAVRAHRRGP
jgi:hypothetical protein